MGQKDSIIAQLKAENMLLRQKADDFINLKEQLKELERRFRFLQEEKYRMEADRNSRSGASWRKTEDTLEVRRMEDTLENRERYLKEINNDLCSLQSLLDLKDSELTRLGKDQAMYEDEVARNTEKMRMLEDDVKALREGHLNVRRSAEALAVEAEQLNSERTVMGNRVRNIEDEIVYLRQKVREEENRLELARIARERKEAELAAMRYREEMDTWSVRNARIENENRELSQRLADVDLQVMRAKQRYEENSILLENRARDLDQLKMNLSYSPRRNATMYADLRVARDENETLQRMLDRFREDADFQKRLREIEATKKIELEAEKKRFEREALDKDLEARMAKRELERVKTTSGVLLDSRMQIDEELNALKEHAEVLENQNTSLNNELERFVETDERARRDLDRKYRVDYLKNKNADELQQSFARVRNAASPKRSPYSSPYRSSSKY